MAARVARVASAPSQAPSPKDAKKPTDLDDVMPGQCDNVLERLPRHPTASALRNGLNSSDSGLHLLARPRAADPAYRELIFPTEHWSLTSAMTTITLTLRLDRNNGDAFAPANRSVSLRGLKDCEHG